MKILIQHSKTLIFSPATQIVQSPLAALPFLPSLSTPGLVAAEFNASSGAVSTVGNIRGFAIVANIGGVMTYVPSRLLSVSIVDPTRAISPIMYDNAACQTPPPIPLNSRPVVMAAEGFNSLGPDLFVSLSGNISYSGASSISGSSNGILIANIASPLQTQNTAQFVAGVVGASTWTPVVKTGSASTYTNARVTGSIAYSLEVNLPLNANGQAFPCYIVKGEQSIENLPAAVGTPLPVYGSFAIHSTANAHYWRIDDASNVFSVVSSTESGNWGSTPAFVAVSRSVIENTLVTLNPVYAGPFFPSVGA